MTRLRFEPLHQSLGQAENDRSYQVQHCDSKMNVDNDSVAGCNRYDNMVNIYFWIIDSKWQAADSLEWYKLEANELAQRLNQAWAGSALLAGYTQLSDLSPAGDIYIILAWHRIQKTSRHIVELIRLTTRANTPGWLLSHQRYQRSLRPMLAASSAS